MGWGDVRRIETPGGDLSIEAFKVRHWGARMRQDTHRGYNGYVLERGGRRICVAGDTARTSFAAVGVKPTDVMVVPIGAYDPWIASHCTPEEAAAMANEARARFVVPVHHQTFRLGREPMDEPIQRLSRALPADRIALSRVGETFALPDGPLPADAASCSIDELSPLSARTGSTRLARLDGTQHAAAAHSNSAPTTVTEIASRR